MKREQKLKLDKIIHVFSLFLEEEYSSKFKYLSDKEDRELFALASILTQLKKISREGSCEEKVLKFPALIKTNLIPG